MQKNKRMIIYARRNQGSGALVPFLRIDSYGILIVCMALMFTLVIALSGCDNDEELVAIEDVIEETAAGETAFAAGNDGAQYEVKNLDKAGQENAAAETDEGLYIDGAPADANVNTTQMTRLYVYVCGAVICPGVYELDANDHIIDAINAAGGVREDAGDNYLNLAGSLSDGMKIYVPTSDELAAAAYDALSRKFGSGETDADFTEDLTGDSSGAALADEGSTSGGKININTADLAALMTLPGIGSSKAEKIIAYREANGKFKSPSDIMLVDGIKNGLYDKVKDLICTE